jgi:predicted secreted protein
MRHQVTQSGTIVHVAVGDEIVVQVPEQIGGGYEWMVSTTLPAGIEAFEIDSLVSAGVGAASMRQLGFRVTSLGRHVITLSHLRSWEGLASAIGTFTVEIEPFAEAKQSH